MGKDWGDPALKLVNAHGVSARVGDPNWQKKWNKPITMYTDWRRTVGHKCYVSDLDGVEYRYTETGEMRIPALIETTFWNDPKAPDVGGNRLPRYVTNVLARHKRDGKYRFIRQIAERLGARPYSVIARGDLKVFWVCRYTDDKWHAWTERQYRAWIRGL